MDGVRRDEEETAHTQVTRVNNRQIAGRDYDHEAHCLACWDGGDLICCDLCPSSYHPKCLGLESADDIPKFGTYACPHHSCTTCGRKSAAAGGLLFRCTVCPEAYCEDHLPSHACIVGRNERLEALGFNHPKQGCYVFCSADCVTFAHGQGLATDQVIQATAGMVLGSTGVDLTKKKVKKAKLNTDTRTNLEKLTDVEREELEIVMRYPVRSIEDELPRFIEEIPNTSSSYVFGVDTIHDVLFETDRSSQVKQDPTAALERIAAWAGVSEDSNTRASAEDAAGFYMRVARDLNEFRAHEIKQAARGLGVMFAKIVNNRTLGYTRLTESCNRKALVHAVALFLTGPAKASLYIAAVEESQPLTGKRKVTKQTKRPAQKDPTRSTVSLLMKRQGIRMMTATHPMFIGSVDVYFPTKIMTNPLQLPQAVPRPHVVPVPYLQQTVPCAAHASPKRKALQAFHTGVQQAESVKIHPFFKQTTLPKPVHTPTVPVVIDLYAEDTPDRSLQQVVLAQFKPNSSMPESDLSAIVSLRSKETPMRIQQTVDGLVQCGSLTRDRGQLTMPSPVPLKHCLQDPQRTSPKRAKQIGADGAVLPTIVEACEYEMVQ
eukprot:TRINITY_DN14060_c1_g1_i1.p1 TRINITY_DN14060_c1_g1~~TRINITY_DN14060_c1_g1_i1.p1  ORF type:complete len:603 (+),score=131.87 TRINITY_DN14060_c1_g1_i1:495-2303(+)